MADPLATVADVQELLPGVTLDSDQVEALLRLASARVRTYTGCSYTDADGNNLNPLPDGLVELVANMVARAVQNPTGATQETTGPHSISYGAAAANRIYLTREDKSMLDSPELRCRPKVRSWGTTRGRLETADVDDVLLGGDGDPWLEGAL